MSAESPLMSQWWIYLSWIGPLIALHGHRLRSGSRVTLLGHPLPMATEGSHPWASGLVHTHWRATHVGAIHATTHTSWVHASCHGRGAAGPWLVHELAVVALRRPHLERGADLWRRPAAFQMNKWAHFKIQDKKPKPERDQPGCTGSCLCWSLAGQLRLLWQWLLLWRPQQRQQRRRRRQQVGWNPKVVVYEVACLYHLAHLARPGNWVEGIHINVYITTDRGRNVYLME